MKLHWMSVHDDSSIDSLRENSKILNECNYYSNLLVYHSANNDYWIKCANVLDLNHKFKYLLAIRTYSISPEYFVMMYKSFNEIQKNRIMFNIVSGDIHDGEFSINDLVIGQDNFNTVEKRVDYTDKWMQKTLSILNREKQEIPEIVMSGTSDKTLNSSAKFANYNLAMMSEYIESPKKFEKNKNRMIAAAVVIRDSCDDAERVVDQIDQKHQKKWTIFGTEEQVIEKIKYLESIGVTDLMIRTHRNDDQYSLIHNLVKKNQGVI